MDVEEEDSSLNVQLRLGWENSTHPGAEETMPTTIYDDPQTGKRSKGELAQIGVLSVIILVFFAIAASNTVNLLLGALRR